MICTSLDATSWRWDRLVKQQIEDATVAMLVASAERVIAADSRLCALQSEIEDMAVATNARRHPVAVDLRDLIGAIRMVNDLERVGDLAKNIAKRVAALTADFRINGAMPQFELMAQQMVSQLTAVLHSYEHRDVSEALEVWRKDQDIDALNNSLFRTLLTHMMEDPRNISSCTHLVFCAKNIERIGDHITNIAEAIYYIVEGREIEEERPKADTTSKDTLRLKCDLSRGTKSNVEVVIAGRKAKGNAKGAGDSLEPYRGSVAGRLLA